MNCENGGNWLDSPGFYRCGLQFHPTWENEVWTAVPLGRCPRCGQVMKAADKNTHRTMFPTVIIRHTMPCPPKP